MKWENKDYRNGIRDVILPSGKGFMIFQYAGRFRGTIHDREPYVPKFYTIGQQTSTFTVFSDYHTMGLIGVAFKPTGLNKFFNIDVTTLTDIPTDTTILFGNKMEAFEDAFEAEKNTEKRVRLIEKLLSDKLSNKEVKTNFIDISIDLMNAGKGCFPVSGIIKKLNVSERYFQKKFKLMVGISPSVYNRIIKFTYLFSEFDVNDRDNCAKLSALFNYYDLSHFRKDFKKYCGTAPQKFHLEKFRFIKEAFVTKPIFLNQSN